MFHKVFVLGGLNWVSISNGFLYGQVAGMIRSLQRREEGIDLSESQISLIATTLTLSCFLGFALGAIVADKMGRRWPFIIFSIPKVINWILLYYAQDMYQFILSRIIGGVAVGALVMLNILVTSEYTCPKTRAFYINMIATVAPAVGTGLAHAIGIFVHWRITALIGIIPATLGIVFPYFWVESPHWLASKERFDECELSFHKLHEKTLDSKRELQMLTKIEKNKLKKANETNSKSTSKVLKAAFRKKYIWDLLVLSIFINAYLAAGGKLIFSNLATVILEEITGTPDVLLFTLLIDGFIVIGASMSCVLIRRTSMRTMLFSTGFTANAMLVLFSICFYLKNGENYFNWINVTLLAIYFIIVNAGPYPLLEVIVSEMFPIEIKVYTFIITGTMLIGAFSLTIMLLPVTISAIGYHGLFLVNSFIMSLSLGYIWWTLPETKGRTLQEIEVYFKTNNFDVDEMLSNEHTKSLL